MEFYYHEVDHGVLVLSEFCGAATSLGSALIVNPRDIHGVADADVPWRQSLRLMEAISGRDVTLTLVKDGDHRLSRPADLDLIRGCVRGAVSACGAATR